MLDESLSESPILEEKQKGFKCRRVFILLILGLTHNLVFFQRTIPSVLSEMMADTYGVDVAQLGIFSSMFFYPYAIIQPFAGLLADVIEPGYLCTVATLISASGALICGFSKTLFVGCIGRLMVGFGFSPIYASSCRCIANWIDLTYYSRSVGAFIAFAGMGGFIAQGPFSILTNYISWKYCYFIASGVGFILALLQLLFVRGNPTKLGYKAVNMECSSLEVSTGMNVSMKSRLYQLWINFKTVMTFPSFWWVASYNFIGSGPYFSIQGMWGGPYLRDVMNFSVAKTGNIIMSTSIGNLLGALFMPQLSELGNYLFKLKKKWFFFIFTFLSAFTVLPFVFKNDMSGITIFILLFLYALFSNSVTNVAYPMVREYYHASCSATSIGCINFFAFASTAICQVAIGKLLSPYKIESEGDAGNYSSIGYRNCLWIPTIIMSFVATICIGMAKDSTDVRNESVTDSLISSSNYQSFSANDEILG